MHPNDIAAHWWAELHSTLLSYAAPLSYAANWWTIRCTLLSYPVTLSITASYFELRCTLWAALHPTDLYHTLLIYTAPCWAMLPPYELSWTFEVLHLTEPQVTLLSYAALHWATLHPTELLCTLLSTLQLILNPTELRYTLLSYAASWWATLHPITELPRVYLHNFIQLRNVRLSGIQSAWYRTEQNVDAVSCLVQEKGYPSPVPECYGTIIRFWMLEYRCRWHEPRCLDLYSPDLTSCIST